MPEFRATGPLPPDTAERVRAYLSAFLPADEVDDAVAEVAADSGFWGDTGETEILAVAHAVLASRLRVATDVEVLVLNEDVGLGVPDIAAVLALPPTEVRRILDEALAIVAEPEVADEAPAPPDATADAPVAEPAPSAGPVDAVEAARVRTAAPGGRRSRRRTFLLVAAAVVVAAVAVLAAWVGGRDDGCPTDVSVCVTASVLTSEVDQTTGAPGADRDAFALGDEVRLWFRFERQEPTPAPLEVRWYRDGVELYATEVRPGAGDELNVPLVALWADEPARYRVEVADDDRVLLTRDFRIDP